MQNQSNKVDNISIKDIPVIVVHTGNQEYLKICVNYATKHDYKIILIGDKENKDFVSKDSKWVDFDSLISKELLEFDGIYDHMNTNPYEYEKFCLKRHFLIYEYVKRNSIESFFMMDSDVLLGNSEVVSNGLLNQLNKCDVGLCWMEQQGDMSWSVSPHFSYWTINALKCFVEYILTIYNTNINILKTKYNWHLSNNKPGGICDMTLLYLWIKSTNMRVLNFSSIDNSKWGIDHQLICKKNYRYITKNGVEIIKFVDGKPYFIEKDSNKYIQAFVIHAQGSAKKYMKMISKGRFSWIEKKIIDIKTH